MAAATGILNQQPAALAGRAVPMANSTSGGDGGSATGGDSATISANDFLTLLVTEMRNQDPTTATDPNQYINQLVQVNSLEQLIGINQTLTTAFGTAETASTQFSATPAAAATPQASSAATRNAAVNPVAQQSAAVSGNLTAPVADTAAQRVAHALDGRTARPPAARPMLP